MHYSAHMGDRSRARTEGGRGDALAAAPPGRPDERADARLLASLGEEIRACRFEALMTIRELSEESGLSERFLSNLEAGRANVSVKNLAHLAAALATSASAMLSRAERASVREQPSPAGASARSGVVTLLGLRGAGKSTIGARVAERLRVPFVELDERIASRAGMSLGEMFDLHGPTYHRRLEREELERVLAGAQPAIVATAGSIVTDHATYELLLGGSTAIWLRASAEDHYARVVAQGDTRPMQNRKNAMQELKQLLRARRALYERAAHSVDTSRLGLDRAVRQVESICERALSGHTHPT